MLLKHCLVFFVWGNYWFALFFVSSMCSTFVPFRSLSFSVCFVAQGPTDVLWDFRPSFFGFRPLWWPVCFGELRTLKGLSRFQSSMAFHLAHLLVENCLICLGICLKFCDLERCELNVYSIILRLGRLHFHAIFYLGLLECLCEGMLFNVNLSSTTQCHFALSKFIIMIKTSWHGALKSLRNIAVPCENFLLNQFLCVFM